MAVDHIQETDTLNAGRGKINQAIDLANSSSTKVDQYRTELDQGVADAKTIATNAGNEAKNVAQTAAAEATQTASSAATEATSIATAAGNEAKEIAETAGAEANVKADKAIADSRTAVDNSNQAIGRANQNKQEFDALEKEFDDLIAQSGDSTPEIVQARTDSQGVKQDTLQNRLAADFGIRLTNADAIQLFSGPVNVPKMMDFSGKVAGNIAANPHVAYTDYTATSLKKPSATWSEITQENYNKLVGRDDSGVSIGSSQGSVIPQQLSKFDTVKAIEQLAPRIFEGMTVEEKVQYIKDNFISFSVTTRAKASSPNNKNLKVGIFLESTESYTTKIQGDATEFTDFTTEINDSNFIDSNGNINVLSYVDSSNGVTAASLNTDYIGVQLMVSLNPLTVLNKAGFANEDDLALKADKEEVNTHLMDQENPHGVTAAQVGAYSTEDADTTFLSVTTADAQFAKVTDLTKDKVGLGNVDNYSTATQTSAEKGESNTEFMTPFTTKKFYLNETKVRRQKWDEGLNWIAHRGNNTEYPENSIPAFKNSRRHWGIETDIQVTSDGKWVVMHDSTVDRTTNGAGAISSMTLAQFRALRIDTGANLSVLTNAEKTPPTLEEYLIICKQLNKVPIIEIKTGTYSTANYTLLKDTLNLFGYDETNCVIGSFDYSVLATVRTIYPNMELHYFVNAIDTSVINQLTTLGVPAVCSCSYNNASVTQANVKLIHASGLKFAVWTVPDASFDAMVKLGVDYITTNSRSGNLRWDLLTLDNGFKHHASGGMLKQPFVEETGPGIAKASFTVVGGVNTKQTRFLIFPDWATPLYTSWHLCNVRTSSGSDFATVDVYGKTLSADKRGVVVGLNWDARTTWANGSFTYDLY
ncbi:glycerophosphodiester phosphodiesterase [Enterococcus dongliensis]|uniref:glycerophosphodiester phosphodiesterase n=1 Tax=Enterococcus dongliensis TaxID=2559925 RepID=UPI00288D48D5|nr:glycerophosphodiester phosphodiesterase [Enterococcus dongliensis]MDT2641224.1 glycerophosphodiester phosphodiesterase [Enterococcus dongliensis]